MPIRTSLSLLLCISIVGVLQGSATGQDVQQKEQAVAKEYAKSVLEVYQSKDVEKFFSLASAPPPQSVIDQILPGSGPYEQLFGEKSPAWKAVESWDGDLGEVILDPQAYIVVRKQPSAFGPENPDVYNCVRLKYEKGRWRLDKFYLLQQAKVDSPEFTELTPGSVLHNELNQVTAMVIRAYQQRDTATIKALSVEAGPWALRGQSEKPEAERLYSQSELDGIMEWQGSPGRVFTNYLAKVKFGETEKATHWVQLVNLNGPWKLKDIKIEDK